MATQKTYNFFAIETFEGGSVRDRYQITAESFEDACAQAQAWERYERDIEDIDDNVTNYNKFELINVSEGN